MISRWFQPTINHYQCPALKKWAGQWWWLIFVILIFAGALSVYDIRFLLVVFILILVVIPIGVFNVYFFNLLSPALRSRMHYQQIEISPDMGITIHYGVPEEESLQSTDEGPETYAPIIDNKVPDDEFIPWNMVKTIILVGDIWIISLKKEIGIKPDFIALPKSEIEEDIRYPQFYD